MKAGGTLWEYLQDLVAHFSLHRVQRPPWGLEAFSPDPVRLHDLVPLEEDVDVGDPVLEQNPRRLRLPDKVLGQNQHLVRAEQQFRPRAGDKNPVLR